MNNKAIQILRGTRSGIIKNKDTKLLPGQPIYNETDNYLTIGSISGDKTIDQLPIKVRELKGYFKDNEGIQQYTSDNDSYGISSTQESLEINSSKNLKITGENISLTAKEGGKISLNASQIELNGVSSGGGSGGEVDSETLAEIVSKVDKNKASISQIVSQVGSFVLLTDEIWNETDKDTSIVYKALDPENTSIYLYFYYEDNTWNKTNDPIEAGCVVTSAGIITSINSAGDSQMQINANKINFDADDYSINADKITFTAEDYEAIADNIKIKADDITLEGYVKLTDLEKAGSTKINGSNIMTGSITVDGLSDAAKGYIITTQYYEYIITDDMLEPDKNDKGWSLTKPTADQYEGKALWRKTVTRYANGNSSTVIQLLVAISGKDGKSVAIRGTAATAISITPDEIEFNPSEDFVPDATLYKLYTETGSEINTNLVAGDGYLVKGYLFVAIFDENESFQGFSCVGKIQGPQGPTGATGATGATGPQGPQGNDGISVSEFITQYQWSESKTSIRDTEEGALKYDTITYYKTYTKAETLDDPQVIGRYWATLTNEKIASLLETIIKGYVRDETTTPATISEITLFPYRREKTIYSDGSSDVTNPYINVSDKNMAVWCAQEDITKIDGGSIYTNSITTNQLATDALRSLNYDGFKKSIDTTVDPNKRYFRKTTDGAYYYITNPSGEPDSNDYYELGTTKNFSANGSFFDLENGNIITPTFSVINGKTNVDGCVTAREGYIADWIISGNTLQNTTDNNSHRVGMSSGNTEESIAFWAGGENQGLSSSSVPPFLVTNTGKFKATSAEIDGFVNMEQGRIGNVRVSSNSICYNNLYFGRKYMDDLDTEAYLYFLGTGNFSGPGLSISYSSIQIPNGPGLHFSQPRKGTLDVIITEIKRVNHTFEITHQSNLPDGISIDVKYKWGGWVNPVTQHVPLTPQSSKTTVGIDVRPGIFSSYTQNFGFGTDKNGNWIKATTIGVPNPSPTDTPIIDCSANFQPSMGDTYLFGDTNRFWNIGYIGQIVYKSGSIGTSDRNKKNSIQPLGEKYSLFFDKLNPVTFKFNDGTSDRTHTGLIAQDVKEAAEAAGLTTQEVAAYCEWEEGEGDEKSKTCGLRYEELISLCVYEIQKLKQEVKDLKSKIK